MPQIIEMKINFPTCRTCKYLQSTHNQDFYCTRALEEPESPLNGDDFAYITFTDDKFIDSFFCSEYTTQDGTKFVNYGTK